MRGTAATMPLSNAVLQLDPRDNVLIALRDLRSGEAVRVGDLSLSLAADVPAKHKLAMRDLAAGDAVIMYGVVVGRTNAPIPTGGLLTTHNVRHETATFQEEWRGRQWTPPDVAAWRGRTFLGYRRPDGQVGTRNYWLVVPLVFCENRNVETLKQAFQEELGFAPPNPYRRQVALLAGRYREGGSAAVFAEPRDPPPRPRLLENVDGVKFLTHAGGCGGTREDAVALCGLIAGYIHHPNVAGATILSLGCQHSQTDILQEQLRLRDRDFAKPLFVFEQQRSRTEFTMLSEAIHATFAGLIEANRSARAAAPLAQLCVGLKCGGSDGFSGISANPAIGVVSDVLAALGGRTILSEFPELCGVEQELIDRSASREAAARFVLLMRAYAERARAVGSGFDMNPSPGNIRDGLLTDAMKSAGAARKGGTSPVVAVLDYPEYCTASGLNLQCTPGNDVECVTAQVGAGASIVLFTTGLGTPTGNPIAPVLKISSNSRLTERMPDLIDLDAGPIIAGEKTIEQVGSEILELVCRVASGEVRTKAETLAQDDFIPWKRGVSL